MDSTEVPEGPVKERRWDGKGDEFEFRGVKERVSDGPTEGQSILQGAVLGWSSPCTRARNREG